VTLGTVPAAILDLPPSPLGGFFRRES